MNVFRTLIALAFAAFITLGIADALNPAPSPDKAPVKGNAHASAKNASSVVQQAYFAYRAKGHAPVPAMQMAMFYFAG